MKRFVMLACLFALIFSVSDARKKDLAGDVEKGVYTDADHNFSLVIPEAWNYKVLKSKDEARLILTKKQYDIPIQFQSAPNYTTIPKVIVYVDTTSQSVDQFVDSLLSDKFRSKQKSRILSEFKILNGPYQPKKRAKMSVGELTGVKITGQQKYTVDAQRSGSESDRADVVTDFYGGSIFFAKEGNKLVMLHMICEWRYFDVLDRDFVEVINGFRLNKK